MHQCSAPIWPYLHYLKISLNKCTDATEGQNSQSICAICAAIWLLVQLFTYAPCISPFPFLRDQWPNSGAEISGELFLKRYGNLELPTKILEPLNIIYKWEKGRSLKKIKRSSGIYYGANQLYAWTTNKKRRYYGNICSSSSNYNNNGSWFNQRSKQRHIGEENTMYVKTSN